MIVKKCNTICSWILIIALIIHISVTVCFLFTGWYDVDLFIETSRAVAGICMLHICLSLAAVFFLHDGSDLGRYGRYNLQTIMQRASGLAILLLIHSHTRLFSNFLYEWLPLTMAGKVHVFVVEMIFFAVIFIHLVFSFSRSFITLGLIRTDVTMKRLDITAGIICAAGFVITFIALARFLVNWPAA